MSNTDKKYDHRILLPNIELNNNISMILRRLGLFYFFRILLILSILYIGITNTILTQSFNLELKETNTLVIDGIVNSGEYQSSKSLNEGNFNIYWQVDNEKIIFGLVVKTLGWVSIGFDPTENMKDADMIFGWVASNGDVEIFDAFSTGNFGPHPPDIDLGGTNDILEYNGTESTETTTLEFSRLLTTDDNYDKTIPKDGTIDIIWGIGSTDSFSDKHTQRGSSSLTIGISQTSGETQTTTKASSPGFNVHLIFPTIIFVLVFKRFIRKKE